MLGRWIKEHTMEDRKAFRGNDKRTAEQAEIRRLREDNRRLKTEKEILKKATVFFASLKKERVQRMYYQIRAGTQQDILDYIAMFYNSQWLLHTWITPVPASTKQLWQK